MHLSCVGHAACRMRLTQHLRGLPDTAVLQFIIDYYDRLPASIVFLHGHRWLVLAPWNIRLPACCVRCPASHGQWQGASLRARTPSANASKALADACCRAAAASMHMLKLHPAVTAQVQWRKALPSHMGRIRGCKQTYIGQPMQARAETPGT